jgi:hypothetical protein
MVFKPMKRAEVVAALMSYGCRALRNTGGHEVFGCPCAAQDLGPQPPDDYSRSGAQHWQADDMPSRRVVAVKTYPATARREGKWWVVEVNGVGTTQGRSTAEAQRMATDLVAIMEETPLDDIKVEIEFELPGDLGDEVKRAKQETRAAEQAQRSAAEKIRRAVTHILGNGMSKQDAARILGVSPQRISQLVKPH